MVRAIHTMVVLLLFSAGLLFSQTTTASLQGIVDDTSGGVLPGAMVRLENSETGFVRETYTNSRGIYFLLYIPVGEYLLNVRLAGFGEETRKGLRFLVGQEVTINITLKVASMVESVTIQEKTLLVETAKSAVDMVINREYIDNLPINGRNTTELALLAPGVVPSLNEEMVTSGGQPSGSGESLVDGVSNENISTNYSRSNSPPDFIQEFQVITNQYPAEFGNASGLILNTITRSGTNDLHGRAYFYHRDERLDARTAFATSKEAFSQKQFGGWLGGPIVRDRTHFFSSYEGTWRTIIATVTSPVAPGDFEQPFTNTQFLAKIDHQFNPGNQLTVKFSMDNPHMQNVGVGGISLYEIGMDYPTRDLAYVGSWTRLISTRMLNEVRFQYSDTMFRLDTRNPGAYTIMRPSSMSGKYNFAPQGATERHWQLVDNLSFDRGNHRLKFGAEFRRIKENGMGYFDNPGTYVFGTDAPFNAEDPFTYPLFFSTTLGDVQFGFHVYSFSGFAQDTWRVASGLTLNMGLRYDAWQIEPGLDLSKLNLAPRLGFAWDPWRSGKTSIRGGWGIFYNNVMLNVPLMVSFFGTQHSISIRNPGYPDPFNGGEIVEFPRNTWINQPDQTLPQACHTTIGIQRQITNDFVISGDYVNSRGRKLIRTIDTNPITPPEYTRPDPGMGSINMLESTGFSNYHGLLISIKKRLGGKVVLGGAYTLSTYKTTNDAWGTFQQDDYNKDESYGYGSLDQRHRAIVDGSWLLKWGFQLGWIFTFSSATPFDIVTGIDNNHNGVFTDRPDLAPGARINTRDMREATSFIDPGDRAGNLPRNAGRGWKFHQLDVRIAKQFQFERTRLELILESFNIQNHVNFWNPERNLQSPFFGQPYGAGPARQVQLAIRYQF
jgi:hypothetical protein